MAAAGSAWGLQRRRVAATVSPRPFVATHQRGAGARAWPHHRVAHLRPDAGYAVSTDQI